MCPTYLLIALDLLALNALFINFKVGVLHNYFGWHTIHRVYICFALIVIAIHPLVITYNDLFFVVVWSRLN